MFDAKLNYKKVLTTILLATTIHSSVFAINYGSLKEFCESDKVVHYFYTKDGGRDVSYYVSYHKFLRRNIMERPVKPNEGNELLRNLKQSSRMGLSVRCYKVDHFLYSE